jgi:hypothetical protein
MENIELMDEMEKKIDSKKHEYGIHQRNTSQMLVAVSIFLFALGIFYLFSAAYIFMHPDAFESSVLSNAIWSFIGFSIWSPLFLVFIAYLFPDINEDEQGLHVKFLFTIYDISWSEILETRNARPLGFRMKQGATLVITGSRLSFFHRLYGLLYGKTINPSFVISSRISDYSSLTKSIAVRIEANRRTSK